jgi:two-component system, LuxR family, response regulator FixJ
MEMAPKRNVYIVDDNEPVRFALALQLSSVGFAVRSFGAAQDFLDGAPELAPGCLVSDIRLPGIDGLELLKTLIDRNMPFPVVLITGHADTALAVRAIRAGAVDFVEKPFTEAAILESIAQAQDRLDRSPQETEAGESAQALLALLTERERQVLEAIVAGLPNKTVAHNLGTSPYTVEVHRARIMDKMRARSLSHLVRLALAAGIEISP